MVNIEYIMDLLDWNNSTEKQKQGIDLAKNVETVSPFLQPMTPEYNKNVWENCAVVLSEKTDEELKFYLSPLLEWLQDMNWPGAFCIFKRLQEFSDINLIRCAINACIEKAKKCNDETWECNLNYLMQKIGR